MSATINITNVQRVAQNRYNVYFSSNVNISNLFYQISTNGIDWSESINFNQFTSPQEINVVDSTFFYVRLGTDYTPPSPPSRVHTSVFNQVFN